MLGRETGDRKKERWPEEPGSEMKLHTYNLPLHFGVHYNIINHVSYIPDSWLCFILLMTHFKGGGYKAKILRDQGIQNQNEKFKKPYSFSSRELLLLDLPNLVLEILTI